MRAALACLALEEWVHHIAATCNVLLHEGASVTVSGQHCALLMLLLLSQCRVLGIGGDHTASLFPIFGRGWSLDDIASVTTRLDVRFGAKL